LSATAIQRDQSAADAFNALQLIDDVILEMRLTQERNEQIFRQIEEALTVSIKPLKKVFYSVGLNYQNIINTVQQGYSGHAGSFLTSQENSKPLTPIETRAAKIFGSLDELNI
jgi:DNA-binding winged helix-turn-helix (wHTH) protein